MKRRKTALVFVVLLLVLLVVAALWGNKALMVTNFVVKSEKVPAAFSGFRIAQISDLYNDEFGENNSRLLALLASVQPDIIAITGDLIDSSRTDVETALRFTAGAQQIAPCYFVPGNHEMRVSDDYRRLKAGMEQQGVVVLEDEKLQLSRGGAALTLLGLRDPASDWLDGTARLESCAEELLAGERGFTVLLCHRPELFSVYVRCGADLALCGHAHGGQFRLPFVDGLFAPGQGLFPRYDAGMFTEGETAMVVSRGIGNSAFPLRINNRPELVVVELRAAEPAV